MDKLNSEAGVGLVFIKGTNLSTRDYVFGDLTRREDGSFFVPYANRVTNEIGEEEIPTEVIRRAMKLPERGSVYAGALERAKYLSAPRNEVSTLETTEVSQEVPLNPSRNGLASRVATRVYDGLKSNVEKVLTSRPVMITAFVSSLIAGGFKGAQISLEYTNPLTRDEVQEIRVADKYNPGNGGVKSWNVDESVINFNKRDNLLKDLEGKLLVGNITERELGSAIWWSGLEEGVTNDDDIHLPLRESLINLNSARETKIPIELQKLQEAEIFLKRANRKYLPNDKLGKDNDAALSVISSSIQMGIKEKERTARENALQVTRDYREFLEERRENGTFERMVADIVTKQQDKIFRKGLGDGASIGAVSGLMIGAIPIAFGFWYEERKFKKDREKLEREKEQEKERKLDREIEKALLHPVGFNPDNFEYSPSNGKKHVEDWEILKALSVQ